MKRSKHDDITELLKRRPNLLGIEDAVISTAEAIIFDGNRYVTSPDNLIFTRDGTICVVEYKSNDNHYYDSIRQLKRHRSEIEKYFHTKTRALYVWGKEDKLTVEKI